MKKHRLLGMFCCSALLSGVVFVSTDARATLWVRTHAAGCSWDSDYTTVDGNGITNNSGTLIITCAVQDSDRFKKADITTVNVHGYDGSSIAGVSAAGCFSYWDTAGGTCQAATWSSGVGHYLLTPSHGYWGPAYEGDFGYLKVTLPAPDQGSASTFRGYGISNG